MSIESTTLLRLNLNRRRRRAGGCSGGGATNLLLSNGQRISVQSSMYYGYRYNYKDHEVYETMVNDEQALIIRPSEDIDHEWWDGIMHITRKELFAYILKSGGVAGNYDNRNTNDNYTQ